MPDWRQFVREHLGTLGLSPTREEEIRAELADHLEDQSQDADRPAEGIDWGSLACEIRRAEEEAMSHTAKTLWVPGVSVLFLASIILVVVTRVLAPSVWTSSNGSVLVLGPLLLSYLVLGALGAWWSRRAGGDVRARFVSGIFPLALHLTIFVLPIIVAVFADSPRYPEHRELSWLLRTSLGWIVIPGVVLAIGALPFLRNSARKPA